MNAIRAGDRSIGGGSPCFIAAEIGINHNGDLSLARQMIDAAAQAGADAVKFQNYRTEDFLSDRSLTYEYVSEGRTVVESQFDMFKRCELTSSDLAGLAAHCARRNIVFFSTPTSEEGLHELLELDAPLLKNGSDFLGHVPLIRAMGRSGVPTVLSTGMATQQEIDDAVAAYRDAGGSELVILHCTSAYPTPDREVNLRRIPALAGRYATHIGLSDHTWGVTAAIGAVALGACFVEKHFTTDKTLPGPDQRFSADPAEFGALVQSVRQLETQLGDSELAPTRSEREGREAFRLSCVASAPLAAGQTLSDRDLAFRRPGNGLPPKDAPSLLGRRLKRAVERGHVFSVHDFED